jgi:hypothetical protein
LHAELKEILLKQWIFQRIEQRELPDCHCRVQAWKRKVGPRQEKSASMPIP